MIKHKTIRDIIGIGGDNMAIIFWLLISLILISILPQLLYFVFIAWVVGTIIRALRPRPRSPYDDMKQEYNDRMRKNQNTQNRSTPKDVIDVEYKERDVEE